MRTDPRPKRRPDLNTAAIIEAYKAGTSATLLARQHHTSVWSILDRLRKAGIAIRSSQKQNEKRLSLSNDQVTSFIGLMDGLLLGDGHFTRQGSFSLAQTDKRRGWLEHIAARFELFGIHSRIIPRAAPRRSAYLDGRPIKAQPSSALYTPCYAEFKAQRTRWYPNRTKQVPKDVTMTPLGLAYWFCGDGSGAKNGTLCFYTNSFSERDVRRLAAKLTLEFHIDARCAKIHRSPTNRTTQTEAEFRLVVSRRDDAQRFKALTEACMPECCLYKFQHVRNAIPRGFVGAKLTRTKADKIRERWAAGAVQTALAAEYQVNQTAISAIVRGKIYKPL